MIDFPRYLAAKKSVDDRALNQSVWGQLRANLQAQQLDRPLRVLELGCGIGTMVERLLEWGLAEQVIYLGIDSQAENIRAAEKRIWDWGSRNDYQMSLETDQLTLRKAGFFWQVRFREADATTFQTNSEFYDLLIANAFMDLSRCT